MLQVEPHPLVQYFWNCFPFYYFFPEAIREGLNAVFWLPNKFFMWPAMIYAIMMALPAGIVYDWVIPFGWP